ncbi:alkaline phosphatase D family protein [Acidovorax lacteus]|uniref:Alkaline phosphatase D family protein n=1 Tax=Acidovorax lacteus TaxID=1924988 RepID=A0ABP8KYE7_9BURK
MSAPRQGPLVGRRGWLAMAASTAAATSLPRWAWATAPLTQDPFALGVASGDPLPDGVVLWTRLVGLPAAAQQPLTVHWEVAHDERFAHGVQRGQATALPGLGHSVHVEVQGLAPDRWYFYRFRHGDATSPTGRTRTAPAADALPARLRVAYASCQRWEHGHYAAWRHLAQHAPDLVLFLGDYIYEYAPPRDTAGLARTSNLPLATTLADFRDRYALYRSDPALQAAHAACPWAVTWDDHEVQNDYAGNTGVGDDPAQLLGIRAAGWQAFYEHMPLRTSARTDAAFGALQLYRSLAWGRLAHLHLLDLRQFRSRQACRRSSASGAGQVSPTDCAELVDATRTLLGPAQEQWLGAALQADARPDATRWSVIAQQTLLAPRLQPSGRLFADGWDGYPAARDRLLQAVANASPRNTVLLGGDIHQNVVARLHAQVVDGGQMAGPVIASEFCGTSISSRTGATPAQMDALVRQHPHLLLARPDKRGYGVAEITPRRWTATLLAVDDPMRADSAVAPLARFVVEDGRPGPQRDDSA